MSPVIAAESRSRGTPRPQPMRGDAESARSTGQRVETIADGIALLRRRAGAEILGAVRSVIEAAPPRHLTTPWGKPMSVAMTNCGTLGWHADAAGYRYGRVDPALGVAWPPMPAVLLGLAVAAAAEAGYPGFAPQACLINRYGPAARMGMHQDRDERDFTRPVVSVSLGRSGRFRIGGMTRSAPSRVVSLHDTDILVFGGPARLMYHGIDRLEGPLHPLLGDCRINLTFRQVAPAAEDAFDVCP